MLGSTKKALWVSRHRPTTEQLAEISERGFSLSEEDIARGIEFGSVNLVDQDQVDDLEKKICADKTVGAVFGVFPAPLLEALNARCFWAELYSAWNRTRPALDGDKPSFEHIRFCKMN